MFLYIKYKTNTLQIARMSRNSSKVKISRLGQHFIMVWFHCPIPIPIPIKNGYNSNVQKCFHWTYSDSYAYSYSNSNGYCIHFGTDIGTDKVGFK